MHQFTSNKGGKKGDFFFFRKWIWTISVGQAKKKIQPIFMGRRGYLIMGEDQTQNVKNYIFRNRSSSFL